MCQAKLAFEVLRSTNGRVGVGVITQMNQYEKQGVYWYHFADGTHLRRLLRRPKGLRRFHPRFRFGFGDQRPTIVWLYMDYKVGGFSDETWGLVQ
jgi:hypothetical protein